MRKIFKNYRTLSLLIVGFIAICLIVANAIRVQLSNAGSGDVNGANTGGLKSNGVYAIPYNPTDCQKDLYNELSKLLDGYSYEGEEFALHENNSKEIDICNSVAKNFVADFFTWSNKNSSYDVGGMNFVWDSSINVYNNARENYYRDLDGFISQYGREVLPSVKEVEAYTVYGGTFYFFISEQSYFYTEVHWTYDETTLDISSLPTSAALNLAWDSTNNAWRVVEIHEIW